MQWQEHVPLALFTFNVGVELGQLAFIAIVLAAMDLGRRLRLLSVVTRYTAAGAPYGDGDIERVLVLRAHV